MNNCRKCKILRRVWKKPFKCFHIRMWSEKEEQDFYREVEATIEKARKGWEELIKECKNW